MSNQKPTQTADIPVNFFGDYIIDPALYDGAHIANPMGAGIPPVCSCGWTRWEYAPGQWFEMADHLRDMGEFVNGIEEER